MQAEEADGEEREQSAKAALETAIDDATKDESEAEEMVQDAFYNQEVPPLSSSFHQTLLLSSPLHLTILRSTAVLSTRLFSLPRVACQGPPWTRVCEVRVD